MNKLTLKKIRLYTELSMQEVRVGLIAAFLIYNAFAILDIFMLPDNYRIAWIIRFAIITPSIIIIYIATYSGSFKKFGRLFLFSSLILGQLGLLSFLWIAEPHEDAFWAYYAGMILIILWSGIIYRFPFNDSMAMFLFVIITYNLLAIFKQELLQAGYSSKEFRWLLANNFFLISTGILGMIGVYHLERSRIRILEETQRYKIAKEKAEQSDRLKSAFLSNLSHEIRTPMNGIIGFSELLQNPHLSDEEMQQYISLMKESGDRMLNIINDLVEISKIESGNTELNYTITDLDQIMTTLTDNYKPTAEKKGIKFLYNQSPGSPGIMSTDKAKLLKIMSTLINNAIKYTHEGCIEYGCMRTNEALEFYVKDTGIGIQAAKHENIFENFYQIQHDTNRNYEGAGLGLSISKFYTEMMGGKIWLESKPGAGSTFSFSLPDTVTQES